MQGMSENKLRILCSVINCFNENRLVESKTRTYHGQFGSGRTAGWQGGAKQDRTPTEYCDQETSVPRTPQGIEDAKFAFVYYWAPWVRGQLCPGKPFPYKAWL